MLMAIPTDTCEKDAQGNVQRIAIRETFRIQRRICIFPPLAVGFLPASGLARRCGRLALSFSRWTGVGGLAIGGGGFVGLTAQIVGGGLVEFWLPLQGFLPYPPSPSESVTDSF